MPEYCLLQDNQTKFEFLSKDTHFPKSSIIILYSGDLILNKIHLTKKYINYKLQCNNIGLICLNEIFLQQKFVAVKI